MKPLFTQDPTGELLTILEAFGPERAPRTLEGRVELARWRGGAAAARRPARKAPTPTQQQRALRERARGVRPRARRRSRRPPAQRLTLTLSGPPVFAVDARALIIREVHAPVGPEQRAHRAAAAVRLPLAPGAASSAWCRSRPARSRASPPWRSGFGAVHGITLGFGVTLIGEAVDYSIYLFVQGGVRRSATGGARCGRRSGSASSPRSSALPRSCPRASRGWRSSGCTRSPASPPPRSSPATCCPPGFPRASRSGGPAATGRAARGRARPALRRARLLLLAVPLLALLVLYLHRGALLNRELAALSPVPPAQQALDERLRADLGAADVRFLVVATAPTREAALEATERLAHAAQSAGRLRHHRRIRVRRPLPALALPLQQARRAALPERAGTERASGGRARGSPGGRGRARAVRERRGRGAQRAAPDARRTSRALPSPPRVDALLRPNGGRVPRAPAHRVAQPPAISRRGAVRAVRAAVADAGGVRGAARPQGRDRPPVRGLPHPGGPAVARGLCGHRAPARCSRCARRARVARVLAPLVLAVLAVAALLVGTGPARSTILHLVGHAAHRRGRLQLRAVLRPQQPRSGRADRSPLTLASLAVANLATVLAFGVLASSRLPMLADLGRRPWPRERLLALLFSAMLSSARRGRGRRPDANPARSRRTPGRRAGTRGGAAAAALTAPRRTSCAAGFAEAVRARRLDLDLSFVALELRARHRPHARRAQCCEELIAPARAQRHAGVARRASPSAATSRCAAREREPRCARRPVPCFAPYLGSYLITGEIARAGLGAWTEPAGAEDDEERRIWRFLKTRPARAADPSRARPRGSLRRAPPRAGRGARNRRRSIPCPADTTGRRGADSGTIFWMPALPAPPEPPPSRRFAPSALLWASVALHVAARGHRDRAPGSCGPGRSARSWPISCSSPRRDCGRAARCWARTGRTCRKAAGAGGDRPHHR